MYIEFDYHQIWHCGRKYQVLIPEDISQLWAIHYINSGGVFGMDIDFIGNRKGMEVVRNACAVMSKVDDMIVFFPCRKNKNFPEHYFWINDIRTEEYFDVVFMKPNLLKISDWKEIKRHIAKGKAKKWGYDFKCEYKDVHWEKFQYKKDILKSVFRMDTVFYNLPWYEYLYLSSCMDEFLNAALEKNFLKILPITDG